MINYVQTNILDMIEYVGEDNCQNILSSFVCPLNPDVEDFIRTKAITFAKQRIFRAFYGIYAADCTAWKKLQSGSSNQNVRF